MPKPNFTHEALESHARKEDPVNSTDSGIWGRAYHAWRLLGSFLIQSIVIQTE